MESLLAKDSVVVVVLSPGMGDIATALDTTAPLHGFQVADMARVAATDITPLNLNGVRVEDTAHLVGALGDLAKLICLKALKYLISAL